MIVLDLKTIGSLVLEVSFKRVIRSFCSSCNSQLPHTSISLFKVTRIRTMKAGITHQNDSINRINPSFPAKYLNNAQLILSLYGDSNFNVVFVNQLLALLCDLKTFWFKIQSKGEDCDDHQLREMSSDVINAHNHLFVLSWGTDFLENINRSAQTIKCIGSNFKQTLLIF